MGPTSSLAPTWRASRARLGTWLCIAAVTLAVLLLGALQPAGARAQCIDRLSVGVSLPNGSFAATYTKHVHIRVNTHGVRVRQLHAALYTFSGDRMGVSSARRAVRSAATLTLRLQDVFSPLQVGGYTLVVTGEPNASDSCGPKSTTRVLKFKACTQTLPVTFPDLPGGSAADYKGFLSVPIRSTGPLIRDLHSSVFGFDGSLLGNAPNLPALFGEKTLDHALLAPLQPGRYNVIVDGLIADQPSSCGRKKAQATMTFH